MTPGSHVVLLGDSIFDNAAYTRGQPDVVTHLRTILPSDIRATLCAVDGATTRTLTAQVHGVPRDASQLVVAIGGNDALQNIDLLSLPVRSSADALVIFAERLAAFELAYRDALQQVMVLRPPIWLCTIYNGALEEPQATAARVVLTLFNDAILRTALEFGLDAIDLRSVCTLRGDYANPIEPSGQGGRKIALAIARAVGAVAAGVKPTCVFGSADVKRSPVR